MSDNSEVVTTEIDGHVAVVTLSRPNKNNAINRDMFSQLCDTGLRIAADSRVRSVVLQGAGKNFCAGIDLGIFNSADQTITAADMQPASDSPANLFQRAAYIWREVPVPVICAIQGVAFGGGLQIAAGADIRIAAPDASLSVMEIKWGIVPDMAITTTLRNVVPLDCIKELCWTGRVLSGEEARAIGLVTRLSDEPKVAARVLADEIAAKSPEAIRAAKQLLDQAWALPDSEALRLEARLQTSLLGSSNQSEAVAANLAQRRPEFADPDN